MREGGTGPAQGSRAAASRPRGARVAARVLLALVLLVFVGQLGVLRVAREPYPGLFQPSFGGKVTGGSTTAISEPTVTATYTDGSTATFTHRAVMAQSQSLPSAVFSSAFAPDSPRRSAPETVRWLRQRLTDLGGGRHPERAVINWRTVTYDLHDELPPRVATTERTVYTFGGQRG